MDWRQGFVFLDFERLVGYFVVWEGVQKRWGDSLLVFVFQLVECFGCLYREENDLKKFKGKEL